jgi:hypothetical protein
MATGLTELGGLLRLLAGRIESDERSREDRRQIPKAGVNSSAFNVLMLEIQRRALSSC